MEEKFKKSYERFKSIEEHKFFETGYTGGIVYGTTMLIQMVRKKDKQPCWIQVMSNGAGYFVFEPEKEEPEEPQTETASDRAQELAADIFDILKLISIPANPEEEGWDANGVAMWQRHGEQAEKRQHDRLKGKYLQLHGAKILIGEDDPIEITVQP